MAQCKTCGRADLTWKEKLVGTGENQRFIWVLHDPHNPDKEFAHNSQEHICPWKAVKHMEKKDRPFYWKTLK